jgi:NAD-dependent SIR2 family protein deacetylase
VPGRPYATLRRDSLEDLARLLAGRTAVVLSGAGCSTGSGIPDYRGPEGRLRTRTPVFFQEFVRDPEARSRYWARSAVGWPRLRRARPNEAHRALADLEAAGAISAVITQNVDGRHQAAGSRNVLELHGSLARVRCLGCGRPGGRLALQRRLLEMNPGVRALAGRMAPDGDAELAPGVERCFRVPDCGTCRGPLKPDVVFFGENVPRERVARAYAMVDDAAALLVAGSSLTVMSGLRFVRHAHKAGIPVVIVNRGATRGDPLATVRVDAGCSEMLSRLAAAASAAA